MDTFTDGLRTMFRDRYQEYYGVGFSQFTVRMFYNKTLFRTVLGQDTPPRTYRELLDLCQRIRDYSTANGLDLNPIASSRYQMEYFKTGYLNALTRDIAVGGDLNLDGSFGGPEKIMALLAGRASPTNEQYRAGIDMGRQLATFFPRGFMSLGRMDAAFSFVQGKTAMITSGSWDARSFIRKIQDQPPHLRFEVGVFELPMVDRTDATYGPFFDGRTSEADTGSAFPFGISRFSRHPDLCVAFLQFCTTPRNNARLNQRAGWIPSVLGARIAPELEAFQPNFVGFWGSMDFRFLDKGRAETLERQLYWPYVSGETGYDTYARALAADLPLAAAMDYKRLRELNDDELPGRQAMRSACLAQCVFGPAPDRIEAETRLLRACSALAVKYRSQKDMDIMLQRTLEQTRTSGATPDFTQRFLDTLERIQGGRPPNP
jgi:ABC-type glycerol-3-phosphate transport system substrate-binding protein